MSIPLRFKYRTFPYSAKASRRSRNLSLFTSWPMYLVYSFLCVAICYWIITASGVSQDSATTLAFLSLAPLCLVIQGIKSYVNRSIDKIAYHDLLKLQKENPELFERYVNRMR